MTASIAFIMPVIEGPSRSLSERLPWTVADLHQIGKLMEIARGDVVEYVDDMVLYGRR
jgi:hypothetical protein